MDFTTVFVCDECTDYFYCYVRVLVSSFVDVCEASSEDWVLGCLEDALEDEGAGEAGYFAGYFTDPGLGEGYFCLGDFFGCWGVELGGGCVGHYD